MESLQWLKKKKTEPQCFTWRTRHSGKLRTINIIFLEKERENRKKEKQERRGGGAKKGVAAGVL